MELVNSAIMPGLRLRNKVLARIAVSIHWRCPEWECRRAQDTVRLPSVTNWETWQTDMLRRRSISEIVREKKYQSRAFLLLPMTFNIGVIVGPILGGLLSDPAGSYPELFGNVEFFKRFPYAAPNLLSAFILFCAWMSIWFGLEEVSGPFSYPISPPSWHGLPN